MSLFQCSNSVSNIHQVCITQALWKFTHHITTYGFLQPSIKSVHWAQCIFREEFYSDYGRCCHAAEILWWKVSAKWIWAKVLTIVWGYCYIKYCWKGWRVRRNQGLPPRWTWPVVEKGVLKANARTFLAGEEQVREQLGGCHQTISADRGWDLFYNISVRFSHLWMLLKCLHQCFSFEKQINCCLYFSKPSELIQNLTSFIFL